LDKILKDSGLKLVNPYNENKNPSSTIQNVSSSNDLAPQSEVGLNVSESNVLNKRVLIYILHPNARVTLSADMEIGHNSPRKVCRMGFPVRRPSEEGASDH